MNKKITLELEQKILELSASGIAKDEIAKTINVSRRTVFNILKQNRVPAEYIEPTHKEKTNINNLISLRLLYFCDDCELIAQMLDCIIKTQKTKIIYVPKKIIDIVSRKKIEKIIDLSDYRKKINLAA